MNEIWADIKGYEGLYQVSNFGRVKSLSMRNGAGTFPMERMLSQTDNGNGYLIVHLMKNNNRELKYVHRLVAEAFCDKGSGNCVNHIDFDKRNNVWTNLEWCTQGENVRYSAERMRMPKKVCKPTETGIKGIYKRGDRFRVVIHKKEYPSQKTLEDAVALRNKIIAEVGWL